MSLGTRSEPVGMANPNHALYRWISNGEEWACCAYDHSPFCRRCQKVDEFARTILDLVEDGVLVMRDSESRGWEHQLTEKGKAEVDDLIATDPDAKAIFEVIYFNALLELPEAEK